MPGDYGTVQQEARGFSVKETIVGRTVSLSKDDNCEMNIKIICYLKSAYYMQCRVNNLNIKKRKMSLAHFKVKQINIYRLAYVYWKYSPFSYCILGLLGVHKEQDQVKVNKFSE